MAATRLCDAQATKLASSQNEFMIYQSFVKSSCAMNKRDSGAMEQRLAALARENSELKTKHCR